MSNSIIEFNYHLINRTKAQPGCIVGVVAILNIFWNVEKESIPCK